MIEDLLKINALELNNHRFFDESPTWETLFEGKRIELKYDTERSEVSAYCNGHLFQTFKHLTVIWHKYFINHLFEVDGVTKRCLYLWDGKFRPRRTFKHVDFNDTLQPIDYKLWKEWAPKYGKDQAKAMIRLERLRRDIKKLRMLVDSKVKNGHQLRIDI